MGASSSTTRIGLARTCGVKWSAPALPLRGTARRARSTLGRARSRFFERRRGSLTDSRSRKISLIGVPWKPNSSRMPVLEVAPVAEVDRRRVVGEEHERRRRDRGLGAVEDLRPAALDDRRAAGAPRPPGGRGSAPRSRCACGARPRCRSRAPGPCPTRWRVLALIETIGAKSRNGASLRIHSTYWSKVRSVLSSTRSHLLTATTRPLPSSTT